MPIILYSFYSQSLTAAETSAQDFRKDTFRMLNANRSLLVKYEAAYERTKAEYAKNPSDRLKRELDKTGYKVKVLTEESAKLLQQLPEETQANELVKYVLAAENARKKMAVNIMLDEQNPAAGNRGLGTQQYYQWHEQALERVSQNRYEEAIKIYEDILLIRPDDDQAFMIMGHLCVMTGQFKRAERAFYNAAQIDPQNMREITPFYENQILKNPNDDAAYARLGYIHLMFKNTQSAQDAFQDALSISPDNPLALSGLEELLGDLSQQNL